MTKKENYSPGDLPLPLQKLVLLRMKDQGITPYYNDYIIGKTDQELMNVPIINAFEWGRGPEAKAGYSTMWSDLNKGRWNDKYIKYAESIVGEENLEILSIF